MKNNKLSIKNILIIVILGIIITLSLIILNNKNLNIKKEETNEEQLTQATLDNAYISMEDHLSEIADYEELYSGTYHDKMQISITTETEYELPYKPLYIELYKYYYQAYEYWYQIIPSCNICTRHYRWINSGQISTAYRIKEVLDINNFVTINDNKITFHSVDDRYQNLDGMTATIYY